jgi:hypothetical protein
VTIDERIEALTMSMELLSRNQEAIQMAQATTERSLQRWAALGVKEARKHRKTQQEIELNITRLSAAQLVTEESMKELAAAQRHTDQRMDALILTVDEIVRGRNGGPKAPPQ